MGVIPIEENKRIDWNAIRAEYIGGGISQRELAKKYGVSRRTLQDRAKREGWAQAKDDTCAKAVSITCQMTAEAAAENATIAADIKRRLLLRISRLEQKFPEDATEIKVNDYKGKQVTYKLRDLTAAFKDITDDMPKEKTGYDDPLNELFKRMDADVQQ